MNLQTPNHNEQIEPCREERPKVYVYESHRQASAAAALAVAMEMRRLIAGRGRAVGIFTSDSSQQEFLDFLVNTSGIEWTRVIGFHLDEYLGVSEDAPESKRRYLLDRLVLRVPMAEFHGLRGEAANPEAVCANYAGLMKSRPPDFAVLGIDEAGQVNFTEVASRDLDDSATVRVVELSETGRLQRVTNGAFVKLADVPRRAITLTVPALLACPQIFVIASGPEKQNAIQQTIEGAVSTRCPASLLKTHPNAQFFLDQNAAASLAR